MVLATAFGWGNIASIWLAIVLAFVFGYALTMRSVLSQGLDLRQALGVALAADTVSILTMEIVDNAFIVAVPGALDAGLGDAIRPDVRVPAVRRPALADWLTFSDAVES